MIVGIGIDVIEIDRIRKSIAAQGDRFIRRVYTRAEEDYCLARKDPGPHFAVRFAAKEALFKALKTGWAQGVRWQDVEILREGLEAPTMGLGGEAERLYRSLGCRQIHVSLAHSRNSAIAFVILEK